MEDALRADSGILVDLYNVVLILVLMEDALRDFVSAYKNAEISESLNPCSNGRCSARPSWLTRKGIDEQRLNPCSNGRCSASVLSLK